MIQARLGMPHLPEGHRARVVLDAALGRAGPRPAPAPMGWEDRWDDDFWGLRPVWAWRDPGPAGRAAVRAAAGRGAVEEAWFVECVGVAFSARMVALSESLEERMVHACAGADEAAHLALFGAWVAPAGEGDTFHRLLARLIEEGDRSTLIFVIQVVLEGWGLSWYRELATHTRDPGLADAFEAVLRDEARHHGAGLALCPGAPPGEAAVEVLSAFLGMVRAGPVALAGHVEAALGPLARAERGELYRRLDATGHAGRRLALLRRLMERPVDGLGRGVAEPVVAALEGRGLFRPPEEWA